MGSFLSGYKTYILSAIGVVNAGLTALGFIPWEIGAAIGAAVGYALPATLRAGYKAEVEKAVKTLANTQPPV